MAHGLENETDMMYVGEKPWHGLGVSLPKLATAKEAITAAGLDWRVEGQPVVTDKGAVLEDHELLVRADTGKPLGVVGKFYEVIQNADAFTFFDKVTMDPHGPKYETAGCLWGGKHVWIMANLGELDITKDDPVNRYMLLSNSFTGKRAAKMMLTPVRTVCWNTLNMAWANHGAQAIIRHTGDIQLKIKDVQETLGIVTAKFDETFDLYRQLAKREPSKEEIDSVLEQLFPDTQREGRAKAQRSRVYELALHGKGNEGKPLSGWTLYNGVTELVDHYNGAKSNRADKSDYRLNSQLFGVGAKQKAEALKVIASTILN